MLSKTNPNCAEERTNPPTQALKIDPFRDIIRYFESSGLFISVIDRKNLFQFIVKFKERRGRTIHRYSDSFHTIGGIPAIVSVNESVFAIYWRLFCRLR